MKNIKVADSTGRNIEIQTPCYVMDKNGFNFYKILNQHKMVAVNKMIGFETIEITPYIRLAFDLGYSFTDQKRYEFEFKRTAGKIFKLALENDNETERT